MNVIFKAMENRDGTWRVVLSRPGQADALIETFPTEAEATKCIETKAGDWLKRFDGDL